jgi:hypothetical protein
VIDTLLAATSEMRRKALIVMDAGIATEENLKMKT